MPYKNEMMQQSNGTTPATGATGTPNSQGGVSLIAAGSPLTRLNYFDGKFLRAADMQAEQRYLRNLVALSNQAGGPGVAYGYSVTLNSNQQLEIGAGLAIDAKGRVLLLGGAQSVNVADLLAKPLTQQTSTGAGSAAFSDCPQLLSGGVTLVQPSSLYLLVICFAETLCGQEDVYGKLCEEACVTSSDRPYAVEGIVAKLVPLSLKTAFPVSKTIALGAQHLRSLVASAYFADERAAVSDLINGVCLKSEIWCLGADGADGCCVPLGVVGLAGTAVSFFDAWTARRERMDPPAKRYWQWRMRMRPWDAFLAQVLQFQCQLQDGLGTTPGGVDPCQATKTLVGEAASALAELNRYYQKVSEQLSTARLDAPTSISLPGGAAYMTNLLTRLSQAQLSPYYQQPSRLLINQGIQELPSVGYLPVTPGSSITINQQVRQWMGEGVNLRYCIVTPDYVQHALEEAQHMERISLIAGLDDATKKPDVDILVPNGKAQCLPANNDLYYARVNLDLNMLGGIMSGQKAFLPQEAARSFANVLDTSDGIEIRGAARTELLDTGGAALYLAGDSEIPDDSSSTSTSSTTVPGQAFEARSFFSSQAAGTNTPRTRQLWAELRCDQNAFTLGSGQSSPVFLRLALGLSGPRPLVYDFQLRGDFRVDTVQTGPGQGTGGPLTSITGRVTGYATLSLSVNDGQGQQNAGGPVSLDVLLEVSQPAAGRHAQVTLRTSNGGPGFRATIDWLHDKPVEVNFTIEQAAPSGTQDVVASGALLQSPDVIKATDPYHVQAVDAAGSLASELADSGFAVEALTHLFPPLTKGDAADITGTECWVMFQRRRHKDCCGCETVQTVTRKYRVYLTEKADATGNIGGVLKLTEIGIVEFAGDSSALVSSIPLLLNEWNNANAGSPVAAGGIYSGPTAAADGDALALGRLGSLEFALSSATTPTPPPSNTTLPQLPPNASITAVDGVILLHTGGSSTGSPLTAEVLGPNPPSLPPAEDVATGDVQITIKGGLPGQKTTVNITIALDAPVLGSAQLTDTMSINNLTGTGSGTSYQFTGVQLTDGETITVSKMRVNVSKLPGTAIQAHVTITGGTVAVINPDVVVLNVQQPTTQNPLTAKLVGPSPIPSVPQTPNRPVVPTGNFALNIGGATGQKVQNALILVTIDPGFISTTTLPKLTDSLGLNPSPVITPIAGANGWAFDKITLASGQVLVFQNVTIDTTTIPRTRFQPSPAGVPFATVNATVVIQPVGSVSVNPPTTAVLTVTLG